MSLQQSQLFSGIPSPFSQPTPAKFPKPDTMRILPLQTGFPSFMTDPDQIDKQQQKTDQNIPENILIIVSKSISERTGSQNSVIMKFLLKRGIFKFLRDKLSYDVVKTIIRQGCLKLYGNGEVLTSEGRRVKTVDILLFGEVYSISQLEKQTQENEDKNQQKNIEQKLDILIEKLGRESRKFKLKSNLKNASDTQRFRLSRKQSIRDQINLSACEQLIPQCFVDFDPLFRYEPKHSKTSFAKQSAIIFSISLEKFYECLLHIYNTRLNQKLKIFRTISIFDPFQNSKLRSLVQKLEKIEIRKNQYVYREGQQSLCFYMLIEGQIEVSKTIDILRQNPNNLYKNRMQFSKQKLNTNIKVLPYANFHGVYNYFPEKKKITLAKINPTCIFGEEEILDGKKRQVNAKVLSLTAKIYEIHLQDIEQLCSKMIGSNGQKKMALVDFLMIMEQSVTFKKILFRQNHLSDLVNYENKSKYGTLFMDRKQKRSNNFRKTFAQKRANSQQKVSTELLQKQQQAPPFFNNFNFTEFVVRNQQTIPTISNQFNEDQLKVVKLTHVKYENQQNKKKEKSLRFRSFSRDMTSRTKVTIENYATIDSESNFTTKKIEPTLDTKITLQQPLFTMNYFLKQERAQRRLYAQAKKKKLESIYKLSPQRQQ